MFFPDIENRIFWKYWRKRRKNNAGLNQALIFSQLLFFLKSNPVSVTTFRFYLANVSNLDKLEFWSSGKGLILYQPIRPLDWSKFKVFANDKLHWHFQSVKFKRKCYGNRTSRLPAFSLFPTMFLIRKKCYGNRRTSRLHAFSPFPTMFSNDFLPLSSDDSDLSGKELTLSQKTNFRLFQTRRVCRRQFEIW